MAKAERILLAIRDMCEAGGKATLDAIYEQQVGKPPRAANDPERKLIIKRIGGLVSRGLVKSLGTVPGAFPARTHAGYEITTKGCSFLASGRKVAEHVLDYPAVTQPKRGPKANAEAFRDDLWKALRLRRKASLRELIELIDHHGVVKVDTVASAWMKGLVKAGVCALLNKREKGFAPTSNGFKRYALVRDLGVKPPKVCRDFVADPNSGEQIAYVTAATSKSEAA